MSASYSLIALVAFASLQCAVQAFSVNENLPVYLARRQHNLDKLFYDRIDQDVVKEAVAYFNQNKPRVAAKRDIHGNYTDVEITEDMLRRTLREAGEVLHPSVLVTMEFKNEWPSDKAAQNSQLYNRIIYVLSFWNSVDHELRRVQNPSVSIHIAGIVLSRDDVCVPKSIRTETREFGVRIYDTFNMEMPYWFRLRGQNANFAKGKYNVIATMTNVSPVIWTMYGKSWHGPNCNGNIRAAGSLAPEFTGLMIYDDGSYYGLQRAVGEFAHLMGRKTGGETKSDWLTDVDLGHIQWTLNKYGYCWKTPVEA